MVLTIRESRKFQLSCQEQSNGDALQGVSYTSFFDFEQMLVGREEKLYTHLRGAFSIARFDNLGNARAYESWNEHQGWLHVFYVYAKDRILTANMGAIGMNN